MEGSITMQIFRTRMPWVPVLAMGLLVALVSPASAQTRSGPTPAIGEVYGIEVGASWWNAEPVGLISSERLGLIGSQVNFTSDLKFESTRFRDLRLIVRPSKRAKFRLQYTPIEFASDAVFERTITFSGLVFPVTVPV